LKRKNDKSLTKTRRFFKEKKSRFLKKKSIF